jgi:hypothetical protein
MGKEKVSGGGVEAR